MVEETIVESTNFWQREINNREEDIHVTMFMLMMPTAFFRETTSVLEATRQNG